MNFWKTFSVFQLLLLSSLSLAVKGKEIHKSSHHIKDQFYHDLTQIIDKILVEGDTSYQQVLKRALNTSPNVFYTTDLLLKNFGNIIPVIDLIQQSKPEGIVPQMILSLRFVNQTSNLFLRTRVCDMYYPLKLNLSLNERSKIINHLTAVVLDFETVPGYSYSSRFYEENNYAMNTVFTSYVKNFLNLHFGNGAIPVGLMYGEGQYNNLIMDQISDSDFLVFCVNINSFSNFPIFLAEYEQIMNRKIQHNINNLRRFPIKPVTIIITNEATGNAEDIKYKYVSSDQWWTTFGRVLEAITHYKSTSQQFMKETVSRSLEVFMTVAVNWAKSEGHNIIIRNPKQNFTEIRVENEDERFPLIVPSVKIQENGNICELKTNLSSWQSRYKFLMVNEKTWRTMVRFQHDLGGSKNPKCITDSDFTAIQSPVHGMLNFSSGISKQWGDIDEHVSSLLYDHQNLANVQLTTVIFAEEDIKISPGIQRFLNASRQRNFYIGCSLSFYNFRKLFQPIYEGTTLTKNTFKETLEEQLCSPMFNLLDIFVWYVNENIGNFGRSGFTSSYSDLMLAREIFMKEFPEKKVLISFSREDDKRIVAEMYDVPIVVPSTQDLR